MHARLNRFTNMNTDALAGSLRWFQGEGLPTLQDAAGFRTIFFGVDLDGGKATGMTFWESESALRVSEPIEDRIRAEALRRAGADPLTGLVDSYDVVMFDCRECTGRVQAVLTRWEGLRPKDLRSAFDYFEADELPRWRDHPDFRGMVAGWNLQLGNSFGFALWSGEDWPGVVTLERDSINRITLQLGETYRPVFADLYEVALLPEPVAQ